MSVELSPATYSLLISTISIAVAIVSLAFAVYSWRQANRPLLSVRVTAPGGGNQAIPLNILIENTGNRPARDIRLVAKEKDVLAALAPGWPQEVPQDAQRCLLDGLTLAVLANGKSWSNAFEHLQGQDGPWHPGAEIPVQIRYRDIGWRRFRTRYRLVLADDAGFAQTFWSPSNSTAKPR